MLSLLAYTETISKEESDSIFCKYLYLHVGIFVMKKLESQIYFNLITTVLKITVI